MAPDTCASRKLKDEESNISKNHSGGKSNNSSETSNANIGSTTKGTYSLGCRKKEDGPAKEIKGAANKCSRKKEEGRAKEIKRGANKWSGKEEEPRGKRLRKLDEETVENYSSGSRELIEGISINDNGNTKSTCVNKKRKFCATEAQSSKGKDGMSLTKFSDSSLLQASSTDLIASGTLDESARLVEVEWEWLASKDPLEPVKDECTLCTSTLWPPLSDVILDTHGKDEAFKDGDKVSMRGDLLPTSDYGVQSEVGSKSSIVETLSLSFKAPSFPCLYKTTSDKGGHSSEVQSVHFAVRGFSGSSLANHSASTSLAASSRVGY
ncbi:hypothetical protein MRB53_010310 [Persea americana]|uniref:Uncharacterized protein n=1 Tax=Persea americana TaxID=3435 RepID=A0ACC2LS98_PERAE|nr:hypothetical protein MRB53_010310 [Persea americana]